MSSSSQSRPDRRAARLPAAAFVLAMVAVQGFGPLPAAAAVPLPVVAVLPGAERTSLVVDLGAGTGPAGDKAVEVTVGGAAQPATLTPVISDRLAVALLVDASDAGAATLPAWLSAAARFILEVPAETLAAAVADTSPPAVLAPSQRGPTGVVRALSAGGQAVTSHVGGVGPGDEAVPRDGDRTAGGRLLHGLRRRRRRTATALAARFKRAATILVVVGTADSTYWADAARATGGFFAPAGTPVVVPALDQVETTLRGRYLVQFPTPAPSGAGVRTDRHRQPHPDRRRRHPGGRDPLPARGPGIAIGAVWWVLAGGLTVLAAAALFLCASFPATTREPA